MWPQAGYVPGTVAAGGNTTLCCSQRCVCKGCLHAERAPGCAGRCRLPGDVRCRRGQLAAAAAATTCASGGRGPPAAQARRPAPAGPSQSAPGPAAAPAKLHTLARMTSEEYSLRAVAALAYSGFRACSTQDGGTRFPKLQPVLLEAGGGARDRELGGPCRGAPSRALACGRPHLAVSTPRGIELHLQGTGRGRSGLAIPPARRNRGKGVQRRVTHRKRVQRGLTSANLALPSFSSKFLSVSTTTSDSSTSSSALAATQAPSSRAAKSRVRTMMEGWPIGGGGAGWARFPAKCVVPVRQDVVLVPTSEA